MMATASPRAEQERMADACMLSLIASMADNKAALGRRYGEWAVSAPTLESAVAAAAMAQDELGHARSTYPLLKQLGAPQLRGDGEPGDSHLALLDQELPDWTSFIAANLLVDGMLTSFVAACVNSSISGLAQRARKILQEERSHQMHAEAWGRRLCRSGADDRDRLLDRLAETWGHVARWPGPGDDPGWAAAVALGMLETGPDGLRRQVAGSLSDVLEAQDARLPLEEVEGWSRWDPARRRWAP